MPRFFPGKDLNAYILAGLQSDHECTTLAEAQEKLERGMYIFIREGSTEQQYRCTHPPCQPGNRLPLLFCHR